MSISFFHQPCIFQIWLINQLKKINCNKIFATTAAYVPRSAKALQREEAVGWWNQLKTLHEFDLPRWCSDNLVVWNIRIGHHCQLHTGEINWKDSASLIVLPCFVSQRYWKAPSAERYSCVRARSSWPPQLYELKVARCVLIPGRLAGSHTELTKCSEVLWICSRWWSAQCSWSFPELFMACSPHTAQLQFL